MFSSRDFDVLAHFAPRMSFFYSVNVTRTLEKYCREEAFARNALDVCFMFSNRERTRIQRK